MKTWVKVLIVTLVVAIPAFFLGPVLFPSPTDGPAPTSVQLPFFLILAATDAVMLGLGVASIALAYCFISLLVRRTRESTASIEEPAEMGEGPAEPAV